MTGSSTNDESLIFTFLYDFLPKTLLICLELRKLIDSTCFKNLFLIKERRRSRMSTKGGDEEEGMRERRGVLKGFCITLIN